MRKRLAIITALLAVLFAGGLHTVNANVHHFATSIHTNSEAPTVPYED
ncbi:hypothetical protein [Sulfobacillus harzensis]|uniref:Phr family secreted Rap phosphatase inhibitor n=1 Tax=Sulfobacillus harzensis TaxID=2729629 RepID=A0A7Y0L575_9FIRM|nr:hypothetical protein [Sulfobacillus harzensis]NMP23278.1 hypothetical protein [Sulfobacillus harzensis]